MCSAVFVKTKMEGEKVFRPQFQQLQLQHLYRFLNFLSECKDEIEVRLFERVGNLFDLELDLVFWDTTSCYFEGQGAEGFCEHGYSRDRTPGRVQGILREARYDGKHLLRTNTSLFPEEVALAYRGLWQVKRAIRELKSGLELRPVYHWTFKRIKGPHHGMFSGLSTGGGLRREAEGVGFSLFPQGGDGRP